LFIRKIYTQKIFFKSQLPNSSLEKEFIDDYRTLRSGDVGHETLRLYLSELPIV